MAFLFKSKKNQDRNVPSRDGPLVSGAMQSPAGRVTRDEKHGARSTPTGSLNSFDDGGSPNDAERYAVRRAAQQEQAQPPPAQHSQSDLPFRNNTQQNNPQQNPNASLYPWSQRRLTFTSNIPSPFPRYGAAVNSVSSKEGDIYIMGGLINSSTVKGDLWMIEAGGNLSCYPLPTTAEGPGPRVGHASLLVGNAFIVYGGDTKIEESDTLDETLYLLNTSTRQWSRALPAGPRPSGRYGHSLNIVGSKIYIFGGQVEGYFMNDLSAFDLNQLQMPNNRWEVMIGNSESNSGPNGKVPPARTNHTMITYNDKLYLFGGTNGFQWFNDVWCYDPMINKWDQLDCIGYIPLPREGHAAALIDDVMYVFGGRTEEGNDLGDLAAFRISSRRWYTFQNMGPTPSPRSGHSMTAVGKSVVVVGGEPSSATNQVIDLSLVYVLDTTKIRYPNDAQIQSTTQKLQQARRPSGESSSGRGPGSREGSKGPDPKRLPGGPGSPTSPGKGSNVTDLNGPPISNGISKLPRPGTSTPSGPPPQGQPPRPIIDTSGANRRIKNASIERIEKEIGGSGSVGSQSPVKDEVNGRSTPIQQAAKIVPKGDGMTVEAQKSRQARGPGSMDSSADPTTQQAVKMASKGDGMIAEVQKSRQARGPGSMDSSTDPTLKTVTNRPSSPPPPTRQNSNPLTRRGSNRNSQTVALLKELDSARNRNAWFASELEMARKSGYTPTASLSPSLEARGVETFDDEDKPLVEALLAMRQELANVQSSVDKQAIVAAKQIAEAEKQRDAAVREAVYAKAKLAAHAGSASSMPQVDVDRSAASSDRANEISRKLASTLNMQKELQNNLSRAGTDLDAEKRARQLADETLSATQKRMTELESYKQEASLELERLRAELHMTQREGREQAVAAAEAVTATQLLRVEKEQLESKYNDISGTSETTSQALETLRNAVAASTETGSLFKRRYEEERALRESNDAKFHKLKAEHEAHTAEFVAVSQRLRDAEEVAERHAAEARTHRDAVLSGLEKLASDPAKSGQGDSEQFVALQNQLTEANLLVKRYQQQADAAADKLRSAEERIAGLEAYQEQTSREGVTTRRMLQSALRDTQSLQALNSELKNQLANQQLETNAITVQHNTLKDILGERGISPTGLARARGMGGRTESPDPGRSAELERQLLQAIADHEETKHAFTVQSQETESTYRERIIQLENDYQSAVHYVKGTEKMLKKMKEEFAKSKAENVKLKNENFELEARAANPGGSAQDTWEAEKAALETKIEDMEEHLKNTSAQLERQLAGVQRDLALMKQDRDTAAQSNEDAMQMLAARQQDLERLQQENSGLETRAQEAEQKVSLLLDQVENSVDNYRRRSRISSEQQNATPNLNGQAHGHVRQESSEVESLYGERGDNRNSAALDHLARELDGLRSHWETRNKDFRMSNTFDFESSGTKKGNEDATGLGLSESLADWRKRLDTDKHDIHGSHRQ
ncbi:hypothetical protein F5Y18DRAFT_432291 [Xylariaceae sp. FL1019]|nr:hypothetical protein F5Y18DRAFT_432291 [Xylariaceae sp. FL1019]